MTYIPWQDVIRPDIERYCQTEGVSFDRAWQTLHTPLNDLIDEEIALFTHLMGWTLRDLDLQDKVSISIDRAPATEQEPQP